METNSSLHETVLADFHVAHGARMVPFAGWNMPVQYADGIKAEHLATRNAAGLFDVSHMAQVWLSGDNADAMLEALTPTDVAAIAEGRVRYSMFLNETGGVLDSFAGFDPKMAELAEPFFARNWIDAAPRAGKSSGAFSHPVTPSAHPYILMNFSGKSRDVMTLAHEMGHGIHQCLAADRGYLMADTPLTLAETASVFAEMLTFRKLVDGADDAGTRRRLLAGKVEDMLNTVVRQVAFHNFETRLHESRRTAELTAEEISDIWMDTQRAALGPAVKTGDDYRPIWGYVPHFVHTPFYVYAYAFGDCLVNALWQSYAGAKDAGGTDAFVASYRELLCAGGTERYDVALRRFGLDPRDPAFWSMGLDMISGMIDELEGLS